MGHRTLILAALLLTAPAGSALAEVQFVCPATPEPVVSLSYGSRYTAESETRSDIDKESNAAVNAALEPIKVFIRDLVGIANDVTEGKEDQTARADCVVEQLATWAEADALSELGSYTANLSIGAALQAWPLSAGRPPLIPPCRIAVTSSKPGLPRARKSKWSFGSRRPLLVRASAICVLGRR